MNIEDFNTEYHLDFLFPSISGNYHLKWAIGETGRTSFVWTLAPPGTHFLVEYKINGETESQRHISEDYFFSIFRWSSNLDSTLSIRIDEDFISFLRDGHSRKDYNRYYYGKDQENKWSKRPIPLGNHVISVGTAAGFLCEKPKGRFSLRADLLEKAEWQQVDAVIEEFQKYLEKVQVPRHEIEHHPRYEEKCSQYLERVFRHIDKRCKNSAEMIWTLADISQEIDGPYAEMLTDRIKKKLEEYVRGRNPFPKDKCGAQKIVRKAWREVQCEIESAQKNGGTK